MENSTSQDLTKKLKVGDTVYLELKVESVTDTGNYPIKTVMKDGNCLTFTKDGKHLSKSMESGLILSAPQYPKVMEVSNDGERWCKRTVIYEKHFYIALKKDEDQKDSLLYTEHWCHAREIKSPERVKLTIQDIADKLGVDAGLIDIIKG